MKKLILSLTVGMILASGLFAAPNSVALPREIKSVQTFEKAVLPGIFTKTIQVDEALEAAKRGFSGGSRLGTGFKSIQNSGTTRTGGGTSSASGTSGSSGPMFFGFFPMPFMGGGGDGDILGTLIVLGLIGAGIWFFFIRPRMGVGLGSRAGRDEISMLVDRCDRNLNILTEEYLKGQRSLEVLKGKVNDAEYRDWENDYAKVNLDALGRELNEAKGRLKSESPEVVKQRLYSFDEDAGKINEFLEDLNERARAYLDGREIV